MPINHQKVLIIYNTRAVNTSDGYSSLQNADWYAAQRSMLDGNGQYYRLGFNFTAEYAITAFAKAGGGYPGGYADATILDDIVCSASQTPGQTPVADNVKYVGLKFMEAIAACVLDNGIEAILLESLTLNTIVDTTTNIIPAECYISGVLNLYTTAQALRQTVVNPATTWYSAASQDGGTIPSPLASAWKRSTNTGRPVGQIGRWGCTRADLVQWVTDALWAETQDNTAKFHMIGGTNYSGYAGGSADSSKASNDKFFNSGFSNLGQFDTAGATTANCATYPTSLLGVSTNTSAVLGTPFQAFGLLYSNGSQVDADFVPVTGVIALNYQPLRGGWAYAWQSAAYKMGGLCLSSGGCAAIVDRSEPYAASVPGMPSIAAALLLGLSFAEAVFLAKPGPAKFSVQGDPLYAPYKLDAAQNLRVAEIYIP